VRKTLVWLRFRKAVSESRVNGVQLGWWFKPPIKSSTFLEIENKVNGKETYDGDHSPQESGREFSCKSVRLTCPTRSASLLVLMLSQSSSSLPWFRIRTCSIFADADFDFSNCELAPSISNTTGHTFWNSRALWQGNISYSPWHVYFYILKKF